jgi:hypothetical protein
VNPVRRCALALHGVQPDDRDWMLARLPEASQAELRQLLDELQRLGIPVDRELTQEALKSPPPPPPLQPAAPEAVLPPRPHDVVAAASAREMRRVLVYETPEVIAMALTCGDWPWRDGLLRRLPRACRSQVFTLIDGGAPAVPDQLAAACVHEMANRVHDIRGHARRAGGWARWRSALQPLLAAWRQLRPAPAPAPAPASAEVMA